jgi:hypothetical protein
MTLNERQRLILRVSTDRHAGRLPAATLRDYWSISSREIEDTLRLFMKDGYVRVVDYNWVLTPQGVALLQGNRVRVVTRRKVQ